MAQPRKERSDVFKVIEDPEQLRALGEAGLLWFYWSSTGEWAPSINPPREWTRSYTPEDLERMCKRKSYAILLED